MTSNCAGIQARVNCLATSTGAQPSRVLGCALPLPEDLLQREPCRRHCRRDTGLGDAGLGQGIVRMAFGKASQQLVQLALCPPPPEGPKHGAGVVQIRLASLAQLSLLSRLKVLETSTFDTGPASASSRVLRNPPSIRDKQLHQGRLLPYLGELLEP